MKKLFGMNLGNKPRAIVAGANGFLGQNLCYWLCQNGFEVTAIGRKDKFEGQAYFEGKPLLYLQTDLTSKSQVTTLPLLEADVIFMLAGQTGTAAGFKHYEDYVSSNEIALLNVLSEYVLQKSKARIVFPSSRLVYKGKLQTALKEEDPKEAKTIYAANKLACENYLFAWSNAFRIPYTIYRICVPYGQLIPGNYSYGTLGFMLHQAQKNGEISLYGDGTAARTFTHMKDICEVMGRSSLNSNTLSQTINIGSNDNLRLVDLAQMIAKKYNAGLVHKEWPELDLAIESGDTIFDDTKLQSLFPYLYTGNLGDYIHNLD